MPQTYIDYLVRVRVEHGSVVDLEMIESDMHIEVTHPSSGAEVIDVKVLDSAVAGRCEPASGVLVREGGETGRSASIQHDPPID